MIGEGMRYDHRQVCTKRQPPKPESETDHAPADAQASYLTQDNDSHWYVVPVARREEWDAWRNLDSDDKRAWTPPSFAVEVGGSPSQVEFSSWSIR